MVSGQLSVISKIYFNPSIKFVWCKLMRSPLIAILVQESALLITVHLLYDNVNLNCIPADVVVRLNEEDTLGLVYVRSK